MYTAAHCQKEAQRTANSHDQCKAVQIKSENISFFLIYNNITTKLKLFYAYLH